MSLITGDLLESFIEDVDEARLFRGRAYQRNNKVKINEIKYEDRYNFTIKSTVEGNYDDYDVKVEIQDGEIEVLECTCEDYRTRYGACKHIVATVLEIANNPKYENDIKNGKYKKSKIGYSNFKELVNEFYEEIVSDDNNEMIYGEDYGKVIIKPKIIIEDYSAEVKVEFKCSGGAGG